MAIRKTSSGWQVDLRLDGRGSRRVRRTFETKAEANRLQRDRVVYSDTKGFKVRIVPITPELAEELRTRPQGRLFRTCYMAFRAAVKRAGIELPRGQCAHVLRHTFASHFVMNGGNILILQRILGHSDIRITMRYAHLAPEHLEEARLLNPLEFRGSIEEQ